MKTLKFICLVMATVMMPVLWAGEPPETLNIHHRDGNVIATAFTEFNHLELSGGNLVFVGRNAPVAVQLADVSKITFGVPKAPMTVWVPVTFATTGEGGGTLTASVQGENRFLHSGEEVEAGLTVLFKAEPDDGSEIRGWRINGVYEATDVAERSVRLDESLYADGLQVEVEFAKEVGVEVDALNGMLNVYVQGREIGIRSTLGIERVELLDISGRLLRVETSASRSQQMLFPVGNVISGIYFVKVRTTEKEETRKVIIR